MKPSDYPVCWKAGFGWGWRGFLRLMFPPMTGLAGYDVLPVTMPPWWRWAALKLQRLNWAIRGPV